MDGAPADGPLRLIIISVALITGLLLLAGCAQVNADVTKLPTVELGDEGFYPTLQAYAGAPIVGGNDVRVLLNGEQIFPALVAAIRAARTSLTYAQYFFEDGPVAEDVTEALAERCRAGVQVHVLLDGVGTLGMPARYQDELKGAGCHVQTFRAVRPWALRRANNRNHRRVLVVDGRIGFAGGSGVSRKWMGNGRTADHWRDTDVRVEGPAVEWMQAAFVENWMESTGEALGGEAYFPRPQPARGQVAVQVVRSSPEGGSYAMYNTLLIALNAARQSIRITNPYFLLDAAMTEAVLDRLRHGVSVEVLVPGTIDHKFVRQASRATWGPLLEAGVKIYEYQPALLHAKTVVIDGQWATIGSTNLDPRSLALCQELNVVVYDRAVARGLEDVFKADIAHATPVDHEAWRGRGLQARVFELLVLPIRDML
ncbi:MAG TPA: phospholipase D-like domain-containing protein [Candidatus Acidoferrum sp.]|nr:phospholipase D-like domain-containing protein [Candidatus Acidoferrum sp.]